MLLSAVLCAACLAQDSPAARDPRVLGLDDALYRIEGITEHVRVVGDVNGDGALDFLAQRHVEWETPGVIDMYSGRDGKHLRRVWSGPASGTLRIGYKGRSGRRLWDAGCDMDGDGFGDYVLGVIRRETSARHVPGTRAAAVELMEFNAILSARSGKDGSEIWRVKAPGAVHGYGLILRAAGDVNADGVQDAILVSPGQPAATPANHHTHGPAFILSGKDGQVLLERANAGIFVANAGDVDGDSRSDLFVGAGPRSRYALTSTADPSHPTTLLKLWDREGWVARFAALGDLDGDGYDDFGFGEPMFNSHKVDMFAANTPLTLEQVMALDYTGGGMFGRNQGSATIYSGKTLKPMLAVLGRQGTGETVGTSMLSLSDLTGDGRPEILVTTGHRGAYAFSLPQSPAAPGGSDER